MLQVILIARSFSAECIPYSVLHCVILGEYLRMLDFYLLVFENCKGARFVLKRPDLNRRNNRFYVSLIITITKASRSLFYGLSHCHVRLRGMHNCPVFVLARILLLLLLLLLFMAVISVSFDGGNK
jgi:hypothetical protein